MKEYLDCKYLMSRSRNPMDLSAVTHMIVFYHLYNTGDEYAHIKKNQIFPNKMLFLMEYLSQFPEVESIFYCWKHERIT